jgi:hypothetical protein
MNSEREWKKRATDYIVSHHSPSKEWREVVKDMAHKMPNEEEKPYEEQFEEFVEQVLTRKIEGVSKFLRLRWLHMASEVAETEHGLSKERIDEIIVEVRKKHDKTLDI